MYLNDCQRTAFYEGIGLDTKEFDMHVIIEVSLGIHISCFIYFIIIYILCEYGPLDYITKVIFALVLLEKMT